MGTEIERKFLVPTDAWRHDAPAEGESFRQFYLAQREGFSVRIRVIDDRSAFLTMKTGNGLSRGEFEYEIPLADAFDLMPAHCGTVIEKSRFRIPNGNHVVEVDVFAGALAPLVVAEIELEAEDDAVALPHWLGREVTDDRTYSNLTLAMYGLPKDFAR